MTSSVTEIRWVASSSTSALHTANELRRGRSLVDTSWAAALREPAAELAKHIAASGPFEEMLWQHLLGMAAGVESNRQLAEVVLRKTYGPAAGGSAERLAGYIGQVESAVRRVQPQLADELLLRAGPLREQWEARGPGLLRRMVDLVDPQLLAPRADCILVHPVRGGGGAAHLLYNSLRFEAVLANPIAELPEILRIAWLLAQLNQDLPKYSDAVSASRLHAIAGLALLPVTLLAAEHVELAHSDAATLACAVDAWTGAADAEETAGLLADWWETYLESRPPWRIALQGLDHLLRSDDGLGNSAVS